MSFACTCKEGSPLCLDCRKTLVGAAGVLDDWINEKRVAEPRKTRWGDESLEMTYDSYEDVVRIGSLKITGAILRHWRDGTPPGQVVRFERHNATCVSYTLDLTNETDLENVKNWARAPKKGGIQ